MNKAHSDVRRQEVVGRRQDETVEEYRLRARTVPGSVYYPGNPPDDDDPWQWCAECRMWHRHGPCF